MMGNLADYFERNAYQPKHLIGERVFGHYQKIPFIGTVGNDRVINLQRGPEITILLDLPMKTKDGILNVICVKHKDIKKLKSFD